MSQSKQDLSKTSAYREYYFAGASITGWQERLATVAVLNTIYSSFEPILRVNYYIMHLPGMPQAEPSPFWKDQLLMSRPEAEGLPLNSSLHSRPGLVGAGGGLGGILGGGGDEFLGGGGEAREGGGGCTAGGVGRATGGGGGLWRGGGLLTGGGGLQFSARMQPQSTLLQFCGSFAHMSWRIGHFVRAWEHSPCGGSFSISESQFQQSKALLRYVCCAIYNFVHSHASPFS